MCYVFISLLIASGALYLITKRCLVVAAAVGIHNGGAEVRIIQTQWGEGE